MYTPEEHHMDLKAEIGVIHLQAKEGQRLLANHQNRGRGTEQSLLLSPEKKSTLQHLDLRCPASRIWEKKLLLFKSPSLWYFVMAALGYWQYFSLGTVTPFSWFPYSFSGSSSSSKCWPASEFSPTMIFCCCCFPSLSNLGDLIHFHGMKCRPSADEFRIYTPDWPFPWASDSFLLLLHLDVPTSQTHHDQNKTLNSAPPSPSFLSL